LLQKWRECGGSSKLCKYNRTWAPVN
jgi:hypothetical protein